MSHAPKRESVALLAGDIALFVLSLWLALTFRAFSPPSWDYFVLHLEPFSYLFVIWAGVFFVAGLYSRETRFLHSGLPERILFVQSINVSGAALFFFVSPQFGIAPKTVLALYLAISTTLLFVWRVGVFQHLRPGSHARALILGSGPDVTALVREVNENTQYPFVFTNVIDTKTLETHQILQQLFARLRENDISVIVADPRAPVLAQALPLIYDAAFGQHHHFSFVSIEHMYEDVFDRVPLSAVEYDWVLGHLNSSPSHRVFKRGFDLVSSIACGAVALALLPFIAIAIKLEDNGPVFVWQERVGRLYRPIHLLYFRRYKHVPATASVAKQRSRELTRVGAFLKHNHLDELPLLWNIFRGDLSFVGPKPEVPTRALKYASHIPYYNARHLVMPGWTGWARVKLADTFGGQTDVESMKKVLAYDLFYLKNRTPMLDLYTVLQSIRIVLVGRIRKEH